ncbi:LrgB family protein [Brevibacillus fulvus]|uniref:Murein hydrolase (TIGR00659 family) n=1 Tax=Brevibacillus fulvus TaxID=1125967 RepID=A0A939BTY3_9BACL|nr:LrgB family protein [Brevibacillus fulvus]MBM7591993.1 putative murein hydrolase (TIGR00659 family) [Brevibacillus fulvus]
MGNVSIVGLFSILLSLLAYVCSKQLYARFRFFLLSPLLVSPALIIAVLLVAHLDYEQYKSGADWLTYMLQPATVAFAIPMYKYWQTLKKHAVEILSSVLLGSVTAIFTSMIVAYFVHLSPQIVDSLAPRSVTTPFAMKIAEQVGGSDTMTAVFVIITGISGSVIGPLLMKMLPIRTAIAKGAMLGMGAHGAGTAKAFELGSVEGTVSSLSMIVAACCSLLIAPYFIRFIIAFL